MAGFQMTGVRDRSLLVTTAWSAGARRAVRVMRPRELELNYAHGFEGAHLDFLAELAGSSVRELTVVAPQLSDVRGIMRLAPQLESLQLRASGAPLDLAAFPRLRTFSGDWREVRESIGAAPSLRHVFLERYDGEDLGPLAALLDLDTIRLERPRKLASLDGLPTRSVRFGVIQAPRLTDVSAVAAAPDLRVLWLTGCRIAGGLTEIGRCAGLQELDISGCGSIPSLTPLGRLRDLRRLVMLGSTRVEDGDLRPLLDLPALAWVSMEPRRHYHPSAAELFAATRGKPAVRPASWT